MSVSNPSNKAKMIGLVGICIICIILIILSILSINKEYQISTSSVGDTLNTKRKLKDYNELGHGEWFFYNNETVQQGVSVSVVDERMIDWIFDTSIINETVNTTKNETLFIDFVAQWYKSDAEYLTKLPPVKTDDLELIITIWVYNKTLNTGSGYSSLQGKNITSKLIGYSYMDDICETVYSYHTDYVRYHCQIGKVVRYFIQEYQNRNHSFMFRNNSEIMIGIGMQISYPYNVYLAIRDGPEGTSGSRGGQSERNIPIFTFQTHNHLFDQQHLDNHLCVNFESKKPYVELVLTDPISNTTPPIRDHRSPNYTPFLIDLINYLNTSGVLLLIAAVLFFAILFALSYLIVKLIGKIAGLFRRTRCCKKVVDGSGGSDDDDSFLDSSLTSEENYAEVNSKLRKQRMNQQAHSSLFFACCSKRKMVINSHGGLLPYSNDDNTNGEDEMENENDIVNDPTFHPLTYTPKEFAIARVVTHEFYNNNNITPDMKRREYQRSGIKYKFLKAKDWFLGLFKLSSNTTGTINAMTVVQYHNKSSDQPNLPDIVVETSFD